MKSEKADIIKDDTEEFRRCVHDVAAALISIGSLAETLAEHVPTLVAMSRMRSTRKNAVIPSDTLDSLPSIPSEIISLCVIARRALKTLDPRNWRLHLDGCEAAIGHCKGAKPAMRRRNPVLLGWRRGKRVPRDFVAVGAIGGLSAS